MGEIADQIIDQMIDRYMMIGRRRGDRASPQRGVGKGMWMSSSGPVPMTEMSDEHIANALAMCERHGNTGKARELRAERKKRDMEMARLASKRKGFF